MWKQPRAALLQGSQAWAVRPACCGLLQVAMQGLPHCWAPYWLKVVASGVRGKNSQKLQIAVNSAQPEAVAAKLLQEVCSLQDWRLDAAVAGPDVPEVSGP